ncbi:MAG TPA: amidase, partial [Bacillota bacterium]
MKGSVRLFNVVEASIADLQAAMGAGQVTSRELILMYMERIAKYDKDGPKLNAILEINPDA